MLSRSNYKIEKETSEGWMVVRTNLTKETVVAEFDKLVIDQPKSMFRMIEITESVVLQTKVPT